MTKSENRVQVFFAATSCDEGTGADAGSAACCRLGQSFNGSACVACSPGTYGIIGTDGLAECTACPATCTIPGLVVTPATCSGALGLALVMPWGSCRLDVETRGSPGPCPTTSCVWRSLPYPTYPVRRCFWPGMQVMVGAIHTSHSHLLFTPPIHTSYAGDGRRPRAGGRHAARLPHALAPPGRTPGGAISPHLPISVHISPNSQTSASRRRTCPTSSCDLPISPHRASTWSTSRCSRGRRGTPFGRSTPSRSSTRTAPPEAASGSAPAPTSCVRSRLSWCRAASPPSLTW